MANPFDASSGLYDKSAALLSQLGEGGLLGNINDYIDPYYNEVLGNTIGRMDDQLTQNLGAVGDQAAAAGAFGGSRHGLVESDLMSQHQRNVGELTSQISSNAFNTATGLSLQDRQQQMGIANQMAGLGGNMFNIGRTIQQDQAGYGGQQQQLLQAILGAGQGQHQGYMRHPYQILDMLNAISGSDPRRGAGSGTSQSTPGLFDYLSLAAGMGGAWLGAG